MSSTISARWSRRGACRAAAGSCRRSGRWCRCTGCTSPPHLMWLVILSVQILIFGHDTAVKTGLLRLGVLWHFLDIIWIGIFLGRLSRRAGMSERRSRGRIRDATHARGGPGRPSCVPTLTGYVVSLALTVPLFALVAWGNALAEHNLVGHRRLRAAPDRGAFPLVPAHPTAGAGDGGPAAHPLLDADPAS